MEKIVHRGKTLLYFDYRGLDDQGLIQQLRENVDAVEALAAGGEQLLLGLSDFRGAYASPEILEAITKGAIRTKNLVKASAVLGVTGGKRVLLDLLNRSTGMGARPFDDIEEAKEWLVEQAGK